MGDWVEVLWGLYNRFQEGQALLRSYHPSLLRCLHKQEALNSCKVVPPQANPFRCRLARGFVHQVRGQAQVHQVLGQAQVHYTGQAQAQVHQGQGQAQAHPQAQVHQVQGQAQVHSNAGQVQVHQASGQAQVHPVQSQAGQAQVHQVQSQAQVHPSTGQAQLHLGAGQVQVHQAPGQVQVQPVTGQAQAYQDSSPSQVPRHSAGSQAPQAGFPVHGASSPLDAMLTGIVQLQGMMAQMAQTPSTSSGGSSATPEVVRPGVTEIARLPSATPEGALQFSDWIHAVRPSMSDLSDTSAQCWENVLGEAQKWYNGAYVPASPIQRLRLRLPSSAVDGEPKWARVKHRMEHLVLQACPEAVKEELSSARISGLLHVLCMQATRSVQARRAVRSHGSTSTSAKPPCRGLGSRRGAQTAYVAAVANPPWRPGRVQTGPRDADPGAGDDHQWSAQGTKHS